MNNNRGGDLDLFKHSYKHWHYFHGPAANAIYNGIENAMVWLTPRAAAAQAKLMQTVDCARRSLTELGSFCTPRRLIPMVGWSSAYPSGAHHDEDFGLAVVLAGKCGETSRCVCYQHYADGCAGALHAKKTTWTLDDALYGNALRCRPCA